MSRFIQRAFLVLALAGAVHSASAFSLLGPYDTWQVERIGYNLPIIPVDIGGPMNLGEEYRWNIPTITYGFDESFLNYFGARGTAAVMQAIAILNNLPPVSQMSENLSEFSTDTKRVNYRAGALRLRDMKSYALSALLEELGLASPERFAFTLRDRRVLPGDLVQYLVIKRNFDPVTSNPSSYVNDALYTYYIGEFVPPPVEFADAVEVPVDPLAFTHRAVVSVLGGLWGSGLDWGEFFAGLTRDDVAGLRYLYGKSGSWRNLNIENLIPGTTGSSQVYCPWCPVGGTNSVSTNNVVDLALRPGVDKITFKLGQYDSLFGFFITVTNQYVDSYVTNSTLKTQATQRVLTQPDILFSAEDLGLSSEGGPIAIRRSIPNWVNNDALNGQAALAGPGVILPQAVITFNKLGPHLFNYGPPSNFLDEGSAFQGWLWGSFDGTTNAPVVFPDGASIQELEQQVLGGN